MTIIAVGNDIIEVARIKAVLERRGQSFLKRILTEREMLYCLRFNPPYTRIAGRFAAKEAVSKALGTGIGKEISWHDIEIINEPSGKPRVLLSAKAELTLSSTHEILLSISHCKEFAMATALLQLYR